MVHNIGSHRDMVHTAQYCSVCRFIMPNIITYLNICFCTALYRFVKIWFMLHHSLPYVDICAIWLHMLIYKFNLHNSLSYDLIIRSNVSYIDMTYMSTYDLMMSTIVSYAHMRFKLQIIIPYADTWFLHTL